MIRSLKSLQGLDIHAQDGQLGHVHDCLFDDRYWTVRYVVVDTGGWLTGRKVLLAPEAFGAVGESPEKLAVDLTAKQIEQSPPIQSDMPVARQKEAELANYFGWTPYWTWFGHPPEAAAAIDPAVVAKGQTGEQPGDPHLRSARHVDGYRVHTSDGLCGHVEDFLASLDDWVIRYFLVDTRDYLPGKTVLLSPAWCTEIRWDQRDIVVSMDSESIRGAPEFDPSQPPDRDYEEWLHKHFGREGYWSKT